MTSTPKPKRKRGGQARNENARKAGFYSDQFSEEELSLIAAFVADPGLDDELWMQRVVNRRLLAYAEANDGGIDTLLRVSEALVKGTGRVAMLLRNRHVLTGDAASNITDALAAGLEELHAVFGRDDL